MEDDHVNLLDRETHETTEPKKRSFFLFNRRFLTLVIIIATAGTIFTMTTATSDGSAFGNPIFSTLSKIVTGGDKNLSGENSDRINLLMLGVGGAGHDGPELTDTIIFASAKPSTREVGMMSIPRDLTIPLEGYGWRKINHVNAYGQQEEWGSGPEKAADVIGNILNQEIHYWVKVDFSGFEQIIDDIGGIRVHVDREFTDTTYPLDDGEGTTETIEFEEGWQDMDGKTALQFVRSRHGNNNEGSDFARAARQQKVLLAAKKKVMSASTLLNPARIKRVIDTITSNISTNMDAWEMLRLAKLADIFDVDSMSTVVLTPGPGSPLYETSANGAYVILPRNDDWTGVQQLAEHIFDAENYVPDPTDQVEYAKVEIQNGTGVEGLAFETSQLLELNGFSVTQIGNSTETNLGKTMIYDLSNGQRSSELKILQDYLGADVSLSAPGWVFTNSILPNQLTISNEIAMTKSENDDIDFLIVLGQNSINLAHR